MGVPIKPKGTVDDNNQGARITHVQFGMFGAEEITRLGEFEVVSDKGYEQVRWSMRGAPSPPARSTHSPACLRSRRGPRWSVACSTGGSGCPTR